MFGLGCGFRRDFRVAGEDAVDLVYGDFFSIDPWPRPGVAALSLSLAPSFCASSFLPQPAVKCNGQEQGNDSEQFIGSSCALSGHESNARSPG